MFLPIGDTPNPERYFPVVTWGIIVVNVVIYLLICLPLSSKPVEPNNPALLEYVQMLVAQGFNVDQIRFLLSRTSLNDILLFQFGYKPGDPGLVSLFSSLFLHGGFMHLAGNMLFLYIYGDNVEYQLGRLRFFLMYLATGVIATLSFAFFAGDSLTPLVGASGAISGVLGFYFLMFPKNKVKVLIVLLPFFINVVKIPARIVLGVYVLLDNLLPILMQSGGGVAYGAHLGGFFGGLGIAALGEYLGWQSPLKKENKVSHRFPNVKSAKKSEVHGKGAATIIDAVKTDNIEELLLALKFAKASDLRELTIDEGISVAKNLENHGFLRPANRMLKVAISANRKSQNLAPVYYELGRIRLKQGYGAAAYQHLLSALDYNPDEELKGRIDSLLSQIAH